MTDTSESFSTTYNEGNNNRISLAPAHDRMQTFCKQMLKTRTFLGHYQENRFVQSLQSYRAMVVISKTDETLAKDIRIVRNRIKTFHSNSPEFWMGYTDSEMIGVPHGACIWTELEGLPFGEYWFQIKTVRFRNNEALIKLKMLKPMEDVEASIRQEQRNKQKDSNYDSMQLAKDFQELIKMWHKSSCDYFLWLFSQQITAQNIAGMLKFICLMLLAVGTASVHGLMYLGAFTLRFMEEFRKLLHVSMPVILRIFDLLSKVIGGLFILLAMIWRDTVGRKDPPAYGIQQLPRPPTGLRALPPIEYRPNITGSTRYTNNSRYRRY